MACLDRSRSCFLEFARSDESTGNTFDLRLADRRIAHRPHDRIADRLRIGAVPVLLRRLRRNRARSPMPARATGWYRRGLRVGIPRRLQPAPSANASTKSPAVRATDAATGSTMVLLSRPLVRAGERRHPARRRAPIDVDTNAPASIASRIHRTSRALTYDAIFQPRRGPPAAAPCSTRRPHESPPISTSTAPGRNHPPIFRLPARRAPSYRRLIRIIDIATSALRYAFSHRSTMCRRLVPSL